MILKTFVAALLCTAFSLSDLFALNYKLHKGNVSFVIPAPIGQLLAVNEQVTGFVDSKTGALEFRVPVSAFRFVTEAMPDQINNSTTKRFQTYYLETDQYPEASFKGTIVDLQKVNFSKEGSYSVKVKGAMTVHGTTKMITQVGEIVVQAGKVFLRSAFDLLLQDYNIRTPLAVSDVFFKGVAIKVDGQLQP